MSLVLGIDTSCDETSAAVLADGRRILSNVISSQVELHAPHGGVVPEIASRSHLTALPPVVGKALSDAGITLKELSGIAVTTTPGLIGCLLVGLSFAKSVAYSLQIPFTSVHHLKGHLFSPFLETGREEYPFLGLVVSGGHTALYHVKSFDEVRLIGQTVDDAAGEAYDKVAKLLGLGYPGGPIIDRLAREGNPKKFSFTRARVQNKPYAFSFSGLKTAVALLVKKECPSPLMSKQETSAGRQKANCALFPDARSATELAEGQGEGGAFVRDIAASFQEAVVGSLMAKLEKAFDDFPSGRILVSGGVAANTRLKAELEAFQERKGIAVTVPKPVLCTDNGAMIAYVGARQLEKGMTGELSATAFPSAPLW